MERKRKYENKKGEQKEMEKGIKEKKRKKQIVIRSKRKRRRKGERR